MMLRVHLEGKAICGAYEREQAEALTGRIMVFAAKHNHLLRCILEEVP